MQKISVAITTYNRPEMTMQAIESVVNDPVCSEIVVVDDCSSLENTNKLMQLIKQYEGSTGIPNIFFVQNPENIGMSRNKNKAIWFCSSPKVMILDSDNTLLPGFLSVIQPYLSMENTILMPEKALPDFIYTDFAGRLINKSNIKPLLDSPIFKVLLNTCNYVVPRYLYSKTFEMNIEIKETDTLWFNYLWLKAGYSFFVVPGLQYNHAVHEGSGWLQNADYNMKKSDEIIELIHKL